VRGFLIGDNANKGERRILLWGNIYKLLVLMDRFIITMLRGEILKKIKSYRPPAGGSAPYMHGNRSYRVPVRQLTDGMTVGEYIEIGPE
jgi:hypothetical protein